MTTKRRSLVRNFLLFLPLLGLLVTGCGDDSGGSGLPVGIEPGSSAGTDTSSATPGGVGHWSALELCSLSDPEAVGQLFPDKNIAEATGLDDPDWSVCLYNDTDADPLAPESTLVTISTNDWDGSEFADSATPLDLVGAEQSVRFDDYDGSDANVLVATGDVSLSVTYEIGTDGGAELGEQIATTWLEAQNGG